MENLTRIAGESGDLFGNLPIRRNGPAIMRRLPTELTQARALCGQLRRKRTTRDKRRIAHIICLNLLTLLRHSP